jgi:hypothetical protein
MTAVQVLLRSEPAERGIEAASSRTADRALRTVVVARVRPAPPRRCPILRRYFDWRAVIDSLLESDLSAGRSIGEGETASAVSTGSLLQSGDSSPVRFEAELRANLRGVDPNRSSVAARRARKSTLESSRSRSQPEAIVLPAKGVEKKKGLEETVVSRSRVRRISQKPAFARWGASIHPRGSLHRNTAPTPSGAPTLIHHRLKTWATARPPVDREACLKTVKRGGPPPRARRWDAFPAG